MYLKSGTRWHRKIISFVDVILISEGKDGGFSAMPLIMYIELLGLIFILFGMVYLIDQFYMSNIYYEKLTFKESIQKLTKEWELKIIRTGVLAFLSVVPELILNLLCVFNSDELMVGYSFGAIIGSGIYSKAI